MDLSRLIPAQGLASINPPATPVASAVVTTQLYVAPDTSSSISVTTALQIPTTLATPTTPPTLLPVVVSSMMTAPVENTPVAVQTVKPAQTVTQIQTTAQPNVAANTRKGLSLTREQMLEEQEMFRTANKVLPINSENDQLKEQIQSLHLKINNLMDIARKMSKKIDNLCQNKKAIRKNKIDSGNEYSCTCNIANCSSRICGCKKRRVHCTSFCNCK